MSPTDPSHRLPDGTTAVSERRGAEDAPSVSFVVSPHNLIPSARSPGAPPILPAVKPLRRDTRAPPPPCLRFTPHPAYTGATEAARVGDGRFSGANRLHLRRGVHHLGRRGRAAPPGGSAGRRSSSERHLPSPGSIPSYPWILSYLYPQG